MIRDAIANAITERWPEAKVTDVVDGVYGDPHVTMCARENRINVELPSDIPDVAIRVATIELDGEEISATFYGGGKYSHNLHHPKSLTDLEDLLASHIQCVGFKVRDVRPTANQPDGHVEEDSTCSGRQNRIGE